ncbi:MAG TPA: hypothetical protein HA362_04565 [Nanoarchaeota archaeon]|nr:hypothetical protein [Nanoarchaeota archaeon]
MRCNILLKDLGFAKALLYRLEDDNGGMVAEALFGSPEMSELYEFALAAMKSDFSQPSKAPLISDAEKKPGFRAMTDDERKGLETVISKGARTYL